MRVEDVRGAGQERRADGEGGRQIAERGSFGGLRGQRHVKETTLVNVPSAVLRLPVPLSLAVVAIDHLKGDGASNDLEEEVVRRQGSAGRLLARTRSASPLGDSPRLTVGMPLRGKALLVSLILKRLPSRVFASRCSLWIGQLTLHTHTHTHSLSLFSQAHRPSPSVNHACCLHLGQPLSWLPT